MVCENESELSLNETLDDSSRREGVFSQLNFVIVNESVGLNEDLAWLFQEIFINEYFKLMTRRVTHQFLLQDNVSDLAIPAR